MSFEGEIRYDPRALCEKFHPNARMLVAYIPWAPFEAEICEQCEEVVTYWGPIKQFLWSMLVGWRWDGRMIVNEHGIFPEKWRKKRPHLKWLQNE
jgi:hypothetical protein